MTTRREFIQSVLAAVGATVLPKAECNEAIDVPLGEVAEIDGDGTGEALPPIDERWPRACDLGCNYIIEGPIRLPHSYFVVIRTEEQTYVIEDLSQARLDQYASELRRALYRIELVGDDHEWPESDVVVEA